MGERNGTRWTTAKILAVVIPVFLVVIAVAGTLVLALGKGDAGENEAGERDTVSEEEVLEAYDEIRRQTEAAMAEMEDLESEEAVSDPAVYEQELVEALAAFEELALLVEEAADAVIDVSEDYEELYAYIYRYYDYLYLLTYQAAEEIEYLLSLVPTLEEIQQIEKVVERLEKLPAAGQYGELNSQLDQALQKMIWNLERATKPDGAASYGGGIDALARELESLSLQMTQALASGNKEAFSSLAGQMNAAVSSTRQQLTSSGASLSSGYSSALSQLEASIGSALP